MDTIQKWISYKRTLGGTLQHKSYSINIRLPLFIYDQYLNKEILVAWNIHHTHLDNTSDTEGFLEKGTIIKVVNYDNYSWIKVEFQGDLHITTTMVTNIRTLNEIQEVNGKLFLNCDN